MAKTGSKELSQLRGTTPVAKIYCPIHGKSEVPMLPPVSCPGCEVQRGHSDLLRRSRREERRRKYKGHELRGGLEIGGMD